MRVYLPTTMGTLSSAHVAGGFDSGHVAHAVTPAIREWFTEGDEEELEYVAMTAAAQDSLTLLAAETFAEAKYENRRVVVAADVADEKVTPDAALGRSAVRLAVRVPMSAVASVHVDEDADEARQVIVEAIMAIPAAAQGNEDAQFAIDEAGAQDLLWYDVTEIADLI